MAASTPTLDQFLSEISSALQTKDGTKLQDILVLEPPFAPIYQAVISELRNSFPRARQAHLDRKCEGALPPEDGTTAGSSGGSSWPAFVNFLVSYFVFIRDVDVSQLVETHGQLKALLKQANIALNHASMGVVMVSTVIFFSQTLAKLSIGLDKRPDLTANMAADQSDTGEHVTLVEASANVIKESCLRCLNDRSGGVNGLEPDGAIAGRKVGIYTLANIALRLFFYCKRLRSAEQVFHNVEQTSKGPSGLPPLSRFPAAQRVTYLYYLGRYFFANTHFYFAQQTLQAAYDQCHRQAIPQRRKILTYLCLSNILIGRFPTQAILSRPEATRLLQHLLPLSEAIKFGDMATFQTLLSLPHQTAQQMYNWRAALHFQTFGLTLVQRSLARRTFILAGINPDPTSKQAPNFSFEDLRTTQAFLEETALKHHAPASFQHPSPFFPSAAISPNQPLGELSTNISFGASVSDDESSDSNEEKPRRRIVPRSQKRTASQRALANIESDVAVLVQQGYLHGYLNHKHGRFVISGARNSSKSPAEVGFPQVSEVESRQFLSEKPPGWVQG